MIPGLPSVGGAEVLILLVIVLLFFGAKRIPELAKGLGSGVRQFREGISGRGQGGEVGEREGRTDALREAEEPEAGEPGAEAEDTSAERRVSERRA